MQPRFHWSDTVSPFGNMRTFGPDFGTQRDFLQRSRFYAVAVRPGDVTVSAPEQQTLALALLALGTAAVAHRRRSR